MNILQYQETELGERVRVALRRHGIDCTPIVENQPIGSGFTSSEYSIFSYVRKSNGQTVWLIELQIFTPPDIQLWRSWVTDAQPTKEEAETIILNDVQVGSWIGPRRTTEGDHRDA